MKKAICIIDDDTIFRMIVVRMIRKYDKSITCYQCENGEKGLEVLEHIQNDYDAIIVFLDINIPSINGWNILDQLENSNFYSTHKFTLYIVSSSVDESDIYKASQYSLVQKYLHKPLQVEDIKSVLGTE